MCVFVIISFFHASMETYILAPLGLQNWSLVCPKIDSKSVKLAAETTSPEPSLASILTTPKYTYDSCTFETSKWLAWIWITMLCTTQYHHYNYQMKWGVWYLKWLFEMLDVRLQEWLNQILSSIMSKLNVQEKRNSYIDFVRDMSSFPFSISA